MDQLEKNHWYCMEDNTTYLQYLGVSKNTDKLTLWHFTDVRGYTFFLNESQVEGLYPVDSTEVDQFTY
jgi:hypothetical protein